jgi:hypothetical protein
MTTKSLFLEVLVIVAFISGVNVLYVSNTSMPCFIWSAPSLQPVHYKLIFIQSLVWHLDNNFSLGTVLQYGILFGSNLLPFADNCQHNLLASFHYLMLSSMNILPQCCWQFNLTAYWSMPEFHQYFIFGSGFNHFAKSTHMSLKNQMLLLKVCLQFLIKQSCSLKRVPISLHHTYTDTCWLWTNAIWFVIWRVPFIFYGLTCSQHSTNDHAWIQLLLPLYLPFSSETLNCLTYYCYILSQHC